MFGIGIQEFGLILVVALLVFGPKRLPELARMLGRGMGEFRRASHDLRQSLALDDLQSDLRRDLQSAQTILKPDAKRRSESPDDLPAQAGDELETVPEPSRTPPPKSNTDTHQGELPLGNDYEHHDDDGDSEAGLVADSGAGSVASHDGDGGGDGSGEGPKRANAETRGRDVVDSERE